MIVVQVALQRGVRRRGLREGYWCSVMLAVAARKREQKPANADGSDRNSAILDGAILRSANDGRRDDRAKIATVCNSSAGRRKHRSYDSENQESERCSSKSC